MLGFGVQFFGDSNNSSQYAVKIDDTEIPLTEFYRAKRNLEEQYQQMLGANFGQFAETLMAGIGQTVIESLISQELLLQVTKDIGLRADNQSIAQMMRENLFPNGYSSEAFSNFLRREGMTAITFQEKIREDLSRTALQNLVEDFSEPSTEEVDAYIKTSKAKRSVTYTTIPLKKDSNPTTTPTDQDLSRIYDRELINLTEPPKISYQFIALTSEQFNNLVSIDKSEIELYYVDHQNEFTIPAKVKVRHILLGNSEAPKKEANKENKAEKVLAELKGGESFEKLAAKYSDDTATKDKGGELGWIDATYFNKDLATHALSLAVSESPTLFTSAQGEHILQVIERQDERVKELPEVEESIRTEIQKEAAPSFLAAKAEEFMTSWKNDSKSLADFVKYLVENSALNSNAVNNLKSTGLSQFPASKDPESEFAGMTAKVLDRHEEGKLLIYLNETPVLVEVLKYTEEYKPELKEVTPKLTEIFYNELTSASAKQTAKEFLSAVKTTPNLFIERAKERGFEINTITSPSEISTSIVDSELVKLINQTNDTPSVIDYVGEKNNLPIVAVVTEISIPTLSEISSERKNASKQLRQRHAQTFIQSILADKKAASTIQITEGL
jgi:peptidyl-prolyl cis-trans isomerase D